MRSAIGPTCNKQPLTYSGMMVSIWAPLSKRVTLPSPSIPTPVMPLTPYHCQKGSRPKKGSLQSGLHTLGASIWGLFAALVIARGVWAPFIDAFPSFPFNCLFSLEVITSRQLQMEMFWAATVVAVFLICMGIFHSPYQTNHVLLSTPLILLGLSLSWSSSLPMLSSSNVPSLQQAFSGGAGYPWVSSGGRN